MVYRMVWYVDGGCRGNGQPNSIGAAAAVLQLRNYRRNIWAQPLPSYPPPTNQRAEITAIIMALEQTLEKYQKLVFYPHLRVEIFSDSRYAIGCMNEWIYTWSRNGWINSAGKDVANQDLIQEASDLDDRVKELGSVEYKWIPRAENEVADAWCNMLMDEQS